MEEQNFEKEKDYSDSKDPIFEENFIRERTIDDAWHSAMWCCIRKGYRYEIKGGSYVGQERLQLSNATIVIEEPWTRPLAVNVPEHLGFAPPTDEASIYQYFEEYLMSDQKEDKEDYTYGEFITKQWDRAVELLSTSKGNTNQCCITIGNEESINLDDPPCLRSISFKVLPSEDGEKGKLQMSVFFRSWDLFAGFPENIGGFQLLKELMIMDLESKGVEVEDGPIVAYSDGLHLYDHCFPLANYMNADKIPLDEDEEEKREKEE